ncbi:glycosyltransferase [Dorea sp. YH-dor226]|uniref:glycosyltransferase n=1 Tax=Dorea sp. YH-dor226 TaxID=3151119 RepID=UPI0032426739
MKKKKLLYVMRYDLEENFNLKMKFDGQISSFQNLGYDAYYIAYDRKYFYLIKKDKKKVIGKTHFGLPGYIHTFFYIDLNRIVMKLMKSLIWDYVYWRFAPCWTTTYLASRSIYKNGAKYILEFPTYTLVREKQLSKLRELFFIYSDFWQKKMEKYVNCFVMIGEDAGGAYRGKPAINISNGINLDTLPIRTPKSDLECIHILALASMSYWHGYDRLINSLANYDGDQKVIIHMVGGNDGGSLLEWKELTDQLGLSEQVIFHGQKNGAELEEMFDLCDVGVNSMGMYRKGFTMTSELKAREYAARGLPFVCSVQDPALIDNKENLWLRISNDDSIPDMNEIVDFAMRMRARPDHTLKLRKYAQEHMTWESQYRKIFELVEE